MKREFPTLAVLTCGFIATVVILIAAGPLAAQPGPTGDDLDPRSKAIEKIRSVISEHDLVSLLNGAQCAELREANRTMSPDEAHEALLDMVSSPDLIPWSVAQGMDFDIWMRERLLQGDDYRREIDQLKQRLAVASATGGDPVDGALQSSGGGRCADWEKHLEDCLADLARCTDANVHRPQVCEAIRGRCNYWKGLLADFCSVDDGEVWY